MCSQRRRVRADLAHERVAAPVLHRERDRGTVLRDTALVLLRGSVDVGGARLGQHRDGAFEPGLVLLIESFLTPRKLHTGDVLPER